MVDETIVTEEEPVYTDEEVAAMDEQAQEPDRTCMICGEDFYSGDDPDEYVCEECRFGESGVTLFRHHKSKKDKGQFGMVNDREQCYKQKPNYRPLRSERGEDS